jgi:putative MATE family efflux protein
MRTVNLTRGSILGGVCAFAIPLLATSVVQQLYSTVDLLFVGNVLGTHATAALGVGAILLTLLAGLFTGISVGVNVKVANLTGASNSAALMRAVPTTIALAVMGGGLLVIVGEMLASPAIEWMRIPTDAAGLALDYLRFAVAAALPLALYNACAGALRGLGDSRSPLIAQLIGGFSNIVANWAALCVLGWGIAGCAFATFVANGIAAALGLRFLNQTAKQGDDRPPEGDRLDPSFAWRVLVFGLPIGIQTVAIAFSNIAVQYQVDLLGVECIAAFAIYLKVELPIYFAILAIGQATTTFVAQNHGAGQIERCNRGIRICQALCIAAAVITSVIMLAIGYWAFWVFNQDEQVIAIGLSMICITFPFYFMYAVLEVQADAMRGFGHSLVPAAIVLANICVLRIILVWVFCANGGGIEAIAVSYPITWSTTALCMVVARFAFTHKGDDRPSRKRSRFRKG